MALVVAVLVGIVLLFIIGWAVVGLVLKLLWWALIGVAIGALARLILPGKQRISLLATAGIGIGASLLGGILGHILGFGSILQFVVAVIAAVVIVSVVSATESARTNPN
jgi:uncharacterized membrane protein YeaQ/YmgE (transglycosylase-associated protein family)